MPNPFEHSPVREVIYEVALATYDKLKVIPKIGHFLLDQMRNPTPSEHHFEHRPDIIDDLKPPYDSEGRYIDFYDVEGHHDQI
jgi:hypothetical protein